MSDHIQTIFELVNYELWCNGRVLDVLDQLTDEECKRDFGFGLRTPHRTMFHIADVMQGWSGSIAPTIEGPKWLSYTPDMTLKQIRETLAEAGSAFLAAAHASHDKGLLAKDRRLNQVFHLVTHGTHHRSQLLSMITLMGYEQPFEGGDFGGWSKHARTEA